MKNYQKKYDIYRIKSIIESSDFVVFIRIVSSSSQDWGMIKKLSQKDNLSLKKFPNFLLKRYLQDSPFSFLKETLHGFNAILWRNKKKSSLEKTETLLFFEKSLDYQMWAIKIGNQINDYPKLKRILEEKTLVPSSHIYISLRKNIQNMPKSLDLISTSFIHIIVFYLENKK